MSRLVEIASELSLAVEDLTFADPVTHVYNPLQYAWSAHRLYLEKWGGECAKVVLVGMNPGPWGMAQTGVPFGEVSLVRDWIGIQTPIGKPPNEHPRRPIEGFQCERREVSGSRLWGWAQERFGSPRRFFSRFFVYNYCPLCFMEESGRNRTPDKLPIAERTRLFEACDRALQQMTRHLEPRWVIGIGRFAEKRCQTALADLTLKLGTILHPSPASPVANRGWQQAAEKQLSDLGVL